MAVCLAWCVQLLLPGCLVAQAPDTPPPAAHTLYIAGFGNSQGLPQPALFKQLLTADSSSTLLLMGNYSANGLPVPTSPDYPQAIARLEALLPLQQYAGRVLLLPGGRDWGLGARDGSQRLLRLYQWLQEHLPEAMQPQRGCPGPVEIDLAPGLVLVLVDSQWLLHPYEKPGVKAGCAATSTVQVVEQLEDILRRNTHRQVVVATYHGLVQQQPTMNTRLAILSRYLGQLLARYPGTIHLSGAGSGLQAIPADSNYYFVSTSLAGNAPKAMPTSQAGAFSTNRAGYLRIQWQGSQLQMALMSLQGPLWMQARTLQLPASAGTSTLAGTNYQDSTVMCSASNKYSGKGGLFRWFFGKNYRDTWGLTLSFNLLDLGSTMGGLTPIKLGGGQQTRSLRFRAASGRQYVLRSIEKYPEKAVPLALRQTIGQQIVEDQISASHPYAALVVAPLAQAASIFHTKPNIFFVPADPRLGIYTNDFAGGLCLLEERANDNLADADHFGNTQKAISTGAVVEKLRKHPNHQVDVPSVIRARLFDMVIGDWDRHDDQWRWATFKANGQTVYKPIPRDRDQAFFVNEGFIPRLVAARWALPKLQGYSCPYKNVPGFNAYGTPFDRSFLLPASLDQWVAEAQAIQSALTDEVIDSALQFWPTPVGQLNNAEIGSRLRCHRDNLVNYATQYYHHLAKEVALTGTKKNDYFVVHRKSDAVTEVTAYARSKKGKTTLRWATAFNTAITKEIHLYGLKGNDCFAVTGHTDKGPRLRIVSQAGHDTLRHNASVRGLQRRTWLYHNGTAMVQGSDGGLASTDLRILKAPPLSPYEYQRSWYRPSKLAPNLELSFNADDGVVAGLGYTLTTYKLFKKPYAMQHHLMGRVATATGGLHLRYTGVIAHMLGHNNVRLRADFSAPWQVYNYFGNGNQSEYNQQLGIDFYRHQRWQAAVGIYLERYIGRHQVQVGALYQDVKVISNSGPFVEAYNQANTRSNLFSTNIYVGADVLWQADYRDNPLLPGKGIHWQASARLMNGTNATTTNYGSINASLAWYLTLLPSKAPLVVANRTGYGTTFTDTLFYNQQQLGGLDRLVGFRKNRFTGKGVFYNNTELRWRLATWKTYLFPAYVGVMGIADVATVLDQASQARWHVGYGYGVWISPLQQVVIAAGLTHSRESNLPFVRLGFRF